MRLAIVSDIHGNLPALEAVIADVNNNKPDLVINLGDCVSGPLWPAETFSLLQSLGWPTIRGNCDRPMGAIDPDKLGASDRFAYDRLDVNERKWLAALPKTLAITESIFACHGTPLDDDTYLLERIDGNHLVTAQHEAIHAKLGNITAPLVLCGHSHIPHFEQVAVGRFVLNVGSVGLPAYDAVDETGKIYFSESGTPHAKYAYVTTRGKSFDVELRNINYDYQMAAVRAAEANRQDWVKSLMSGRMG